MRVLRDLLSPILLNEPPLQRMNGSSAYSADNRRGLREPDRLLAAATGIAPAQSREVVDDVNSV